MTSKPTSAASLPIEKKQVFISHVSFEANLAGALKDWIEKAFPRRVDAFVSATGMSIGTFRPQIEQQLRESSVLLVLTSRFSAASTWVSFEAGFAKALHQATIPIISPPLGASQLPPTLAQLQTRLLSDQDFPKQLIKDDLSKELGLKPRRGFAFVNMRRAILKARKQQFLMLRLMRKIKDLEDVADKTPPRLLEALKTRSLPAVRDALDTLARGDYVGDADVDDPAEMGYELTKRGHAILDLEGTAIT